MLTFVIKGLGIVLVKNKSFEGIPEMRNAFKHFNLQHWTDFGYKRYDLNGHAESPPDIHPTGSFGIKMKPSDGKSYIGLVVRDIDTWEGISQKLNKILENGTCYEFTIDLSQSDVFDNYSRKSGKKASYVHPTKFRMWGGNESCSEQQLLAESPPIDFYYWQTFKFKIKPKEDITYITLEAIYTSTKLEPYNGHILIDNMSDIIEVDCGK